MGDFDYTVDAKTNVVRAFAILATIVGAIAGVASAMVTCSNNPNPAMWKLAGFLFMAASAFQGITLMILQSSICLDNPLIQYMKDTSVFTRRFSNECEVD